jgi:hypothetical protein
MSATPDMNMNVNNGLAESLLEVNQVSYRLPPQISITSKCTHVINYSQQSIYSNTAKTVIFDVQTGSQFVDPACSYLRMIVKPGTTGFCFGSGSACNLIQRVVVRTANGKELSRVEDANLLIKMMDVFNNSKDWRNTTGKSQGYSDPSDIKANVYGDLVPTTGKLFIIPVQTFMPCMSPHGAKLVPPNIMSGLRIEITLADPQDAFCRVNQATGLVNLGAYTVEQCELHLKTYELADAFARKIAEMSQSGLNYLYKEHFHNIVSAGTNTNINFDIKKACSKALTARVMPRLSNIPAGRDAVASLPYTVNKLQSHIGETYWPNQPLQLDGTPTADNVNEHYYYALYAQNKLENWNPTGVSPKEFLGRTVDGTANDVYSSGIVAWSFNKSNVSDLSGYTTSNSRALLVDLQRDGADNVRLDVYLTFLRLAKAYLSNTIVLD